MPDEDEDDVVVVVVGIKSLDLGNARGSVKNASLTNGARREEAKRLLSSARVLLHSG